MFGLVNVYIYTYFIINITLVILVCFFFKYNTVHRVNCFVKKMHKLSRIFRNKVMKRLVI